MNQAAGTQRPGGRGPTRRPFPSRRTLIAAAGCLLASGPSAGATAAMGRARAARGSFVIAADQASRRVLILDPTEPSWADRSILRARDLEPQWSWAPGGDPDLEDLRPDGHWGNVSEAKSRLRHGVRWVLTCSSEGFAAVVSYPAGSVYWAAAVPGVNLHSLELLPDGNVAVAASTGGFIRVYAASDVSRATRYAHYDLPGARGLQWESKNSLLWALGKTRLVALDSDGTPSRPHLTPLWHIDLPETQGHDLASVACHPGRLWVTTTRHVRQFSTADQDFVPDAVPDAVDRPGVKSIGDDPLTCQILSVTPQPGNPCTWCTSTVQLHQPGERQHLVGAGFYKARWFSPPD